MDGAPGRAPVAMMPPAARQAVGSGSGLVELDAQAKLHLVDEKLAKGEASREPFVEDLGRLADATDAFFERMPNGDHSLHLYVRDLYEPRRTSGDRRGLYVVIWLDPVARIRTLFPKADLAYWMKQAARPSAKKIDL